MPTLYLTEASETMVNLLQNKHFSVSARSGFASAFSTPASQACQHGASRLVSTPPGCAGRLVSFSHSGLRGD
jgi:hypothetical protein